MSQNDKAEQKEKTARAFMELVETVARLRAPDGCPWDRAQTHESLKPPCIEEAAEVICGINILSQTGRHESLCEELGDMLLQVLMHALIAEEEGLFTLEDVLYTLNAKMIRRHPHVFGKKSLEYLPDSAKTLLTDTFREEGSCAEEQYAALIADWKRIKSFEKQGREWEEPYLFEAFTEAGRLIDVARKRKNL